MRILQKIMQWYIGRMSREEKEVLLEQTVTQFFGSMEPEEKQELLEKMLLKVLDDVDMKEFLPRILSTMWKGAGSSDEQAGILNTMSKIAGETGGKLSGIVRSFKG
ncbi:MAG: hypothetical protein GY801_49355 [bacterium]|nr:hypothetical protein [bacterium]